MRLYVRRVPTASGLTAVQVVRSHHGRVELVTHVGSAHDGDELALLEETADRIVHQGEDPLFPADSTKVSSAISSVSVASTFSGLLWGQLSIWWTRLGFDVIDDEVFKQVVLARIVEPTSKADSIRVMTGLGIAPPSESAIYRSLRRCQDNDYRSLLSGACWNNVVKSGPVGLLMFDVTTLWFEIHEDDDFRKPGYSKERRLEPQIIVGLLVGAHGFPLSIQAFEGNKAETLTIVPVVKQFMASRKLQRLTIVADAGMLTETNLAGLEDAGLDFIVGSKTTKFPYYLDARAEAHPQDREPADGWTGWWHMPIPPGNRRRNLIIQYRAKRARLDLSNIDKQVAKAALMVSGAKPATHARFIKIQGGKRSLNQPVIDRAKRLAGYKGYVTNLALDGPDGLDPAMLIASYHQLYEVENSFRMSKHDLKARPVFHHLKDSIQAHLTVVYAALAISRAIQDTTGVTINRWRRTLAPIRTAVININSHQLTIPPAIPDHIKPLLTAD